MEISRYLKWTPLLLLLLIPFFILRGCTPKCPKPAENIPGTENFREDCPVEDPNNPTTNGQANALDFYVLSDGAEAFQEQIQAFQSQNSTVKINLKTFTNATDYEDLIINELAEGGGPDVFMIHNSWITKHVKKLSPMPLDLPIAMTPDLFRQTFFQAAAQDLIVDQQIYGMPLAIDNLAIYYNKSQFNDLLGSSNKPGQLWEQIQQQVSSITRPNNSLERFALAGIAMGRSDNISSAVDILYGLMLEYGVKFYDENEQQATFAEGNAFATDGIKNPGAEALALFTSFALPSSKTYSWNQNITAFSEKEKEINPFIRGKVSMIVGYPSIYNQIEKSIETAQKLGQEHIDIDEVGIAPFPQLVNPQESARKDTYASYFPLVVARTSNNPREAWSFIQFLTNAQSLQTYNKKTHRPTSRFDMVNEQQTDPLFGIFSGQAAYAKSFRVYDDEAYREVFSKAIDQVVQSLATPEEALKEAQMKITCVLQKEKKMIDIGTDCQI